MLDDAIDNDARLQARAGVIEEDTVRRAAGSIRSHLLYFGIGKSFSHHTSLYC